MSTESTLKVFENPRFGSVRTTTENGEPWFCLVDVCKVLGLSTPSKVKERLTDPCMNTIQVWVQTGVKEDGEPAMRKTQMLFVNEQGLYKVIFQSRKPEAEQFTDWVTGEVLPSIRKTGLYAAETVTSDMMFQLAKAMQEKEQRIAALEEENGAQMKYIEAAKPKVVFADAVSTSDTCILIGELAKLLKGNGIEIGQNRLFDWLREKGYLIKRRGTDYNAPTQKAMELGLFKVNESTVTNSNGKIIITKTTKVTGKGQQYFINAFLSEAESIVS